MTKKFTVSQWGNKAANISLGISGFNWGMILNPVSEFIPLKLRNGYFEMFECAIGGECKSLIIERNFGSFPNKVPNASQNR